MDEKVIAVIVVVVIVLLLPLAYYLAKGPEPLTFDTIKQTYRENNYSIGNEQSVKEPTNGSTAEISLTINGAPARLFLFADATVIDGAMTALEMEGLQSIPAWMPKDASCVVRNGSYVLMITTEKDDLRDRVTQLFQAMENPTQ